MRLIQRLVISLLILVVFAAPAAADWYPDYTGSPNYGADYDGAAKAAVDHIYPGHGDFVSSSWGISPQNRIVTYGKCAKRAPGMISPPYWCAGAHNICGTGLIQWLFGCLSNNVTYQGNCFTCKNPQRGVSGDPSGRGAPVSDPINVVSGNVFETTTDFETTGQDTLALRRFYNSDQTYVKTPQARYSSSTTFLYSRFGYGWRSQFDVFIRPDSTTPSSATAIDLITSDGNPVFFQKSSGVWTVRYSTAGGGWSSSTDPRHDIDLTISTDGTSWFVVDSDDTTYKFDNTGKLTSITLRSGYQQTLGYDGSGNNTTVTDSFGRTLTFTYLANGLTDTMTDADGKVTHYAYLERSGSSPPIPGGNVGLWVLQAVTHQDSTVTTYLYEDTNPINRFALRALPMKTAIASRPGLMTRPLAASHPTA